MASRWTAPLLALLALLPGAAAQAPAWLGPDMGAPYVVLAEAADGELEVGTVQLLVAEDRGATLRVRVRSGDDALGQLFGAGDYVIARATREILEAAPQSRAAPGEHLGWWLEPAALPAAGAEVEVEGASYRVAGPAERQGRAVLALHGNMTVPFEGRARSYQVERFYGTQDGLLVGAEVRRADKPGRVAALKLDLASDGPVRGALPPELATIALLGPASFGMAFVAMLAARSLYGKPASERGPGFCTQCGRPAAREGRCPSCGASLGVGL